MAKTGLMIFGVLIGVPMTVLHVWSVRGMIVGKASAPSSPELPSLSYDEGGGFAGVSEELASAEQSAAAEYEFSAGLKTAA